MRLISRHILRTMVAPFIWGVVALTGTAAAQCAAAPDRPRSVGRGFDFRNDRQGILLFAPSLRRPDPADGGPGQRALRLQPARRQPRNGGDVRQRHLGLADGAPGADRRRRWSPWSTSCVFDQLMPKSNVRFTTCAPPSQQKLPTLALRQQVLNVLPARIRLYPSRRRDRPGRSGRCSSVTIFDLTDNVDQARRLIIADSGMMAESVRRQGPDR